MENMSVAVLNSDFTYLGMIPWERSIVLLYQNKAESVKETDTVIHNHDKSVSYTIPKIIRLINHVSSLYKRKMGYSKRNIFLRDGYTCQYCGKKLELHECTIDHVKPKIAGGKSSWLNCVCACKRCNSFKDDKFLEDINMSLIKEPYTPSTADIMRLRFKNIASQIELALKE